MRSDLFLARDHDAADDTAGLSPERWADWLLFVVRRGLIACAALQNYLAPHLTSAERAEVETTFQEFLKFKQSAVRAGAHLLPGDTPRDD